MVMERSTTHMEPWENLRKVDLIHEYLTKNNMKYLIPKGFKDFQNDDADNHNK